MTDKPAQDQNVWLVPGEIWKRDGRLFRVNPTDPGAAPHELVSNVAYGTDVFLIGMFAFFAGIILASIFWSITSFQSYSKPVEFTAEEKIGTRIQPTFPMTFSVSIVPMEYIKKTAPGADAFTYVGTRDAECRIYIPAGRGIVFTSLEKSAAWQNRYDGDVLAHEILHCLRGHWHNDK
jgi:hypothetical protein